MFGGGRRLTAVLEADGFVSRYRPELEDYVAKPLRTGTLVLSLKTLASNTRLYKAILASGLLISCAAPSAAALSGWLGHWARHVHAVELKPSVAETLIELIGPEIGLLDQELAKLALAVGNDKRVTDELVDRLVRAGAWRAKTAWEMLDFVLDGDARAAMVQLDRLLASGEQPLGILAQVSYSLRRFAAATRLVLQAEAAGKRITPRDALAQVGTKPFILQRAEGQLRRLGRVRGAQLYDWLLEADLDMKGQSPLPPRLILERLFLRLAAPAPQPAAR
jgi:DNA polymerase-3 subunit delta